MRRTPVPSISIRCSAHGAGRFHMSKITELTAQLARPVAEANGCSLWDVEYVK